MSFIRQSVKDPWFVSLTGIFLLVIAVAGVWHSVCAGVAQGYYHRAKYGKTEMGTGCLLELCHKAYAWYPDNYYFSILAAEKAYYTAAGEDAGLRQRRLEQAAFWCERGLVQNWWKGQLRRLKVRFLWEASPSEAIRFWEEYTDWQFWEPYNHAVLAELYAGAGDFEKAGMALKWAEGTAEGEEARRVVEQQKKEWDAVLSGQDG